MTAADRPEPPLARTSLRLALLLTFTTGLVDAYTYMTRGGVFANAQTGNVILGAIALTQGSFGKAGLHLTSILVFVVAVGVASRLRRSPTEPTSWSAAISALGLSLAVFTLVTFLPASAPALLATVPITFVAGIQLELFRTAGGLSYAPIATTGNLLRWVESGHAHLTHPTVTTRHTFGVYCWLIASFATGAVVGAGITEVAGVRACGVAAATTALALVLVLVDRRRTVTRPADPST